ncbi:MAG TPA: cation-transporting P-type ATPase, partial [Gemmatimonadaceae bacterium]
SCVALSAPGLSSAEALARLAEYGANELAPARRAGLLRELLRGLLSPLMVILLAASALAATVGQITDAIIIGVTVLLGAARDAFQTSRSTAAVERLRQSVVPLATVWRDGHWCEIARHELVPGDVIHLSAGDVVPADAWLVSTRGLHVQQAALTGESFPANKQASRDAGTYAKKPADPTEPDAVFMGTSVVSGVGIAMVAGTGSTTAFGAIAARLREELTFVGLLTFTDPPLSDAGELIAR